MRKKMFVAVAISSLAMASEAGVTVNVDKAVNDDLVDSFKDYDIESEMLKYHRPLLQGIINGARNLPVDEMLLASYNGDASDIDAVGGCYDNCYKNCHGSRSWR
tara:strand:+ start:3748 stop:4059 length:312 start_codon:yes stop_codon:yes gene_type:complete